MFEKIRLNQPQVYIWMTWNEEVMVNQVKKAQVKSIKCIKSQTKTYVKWLKMEIKEKNLKLWSKWFKNGCKIYTKSQILCMNRSQRLDAKMFWNGWKIIWKRKWNKNNNKCKNDLKNMRKKHVVQNIKVASEGVDKGFWVDICS